MDDLARASVVSHPSSQERSKDGAPRSYSHRPSGALSSPLVCLPRVSPWAIVDHPSGMKGPAKGGWGRVGDLVRAISAQVFAWLMSFCGLPPFELRTLEGWGTRSLFILESKRLWSQAWTSSGTGGGKTRSRSMRRSVETTTSMRTPLGSSMMTSPACGMRPSISLTSPASVVAS